MGVLECYVQYWVFLFTFASCRCWAARPWRMPPQHQPPARLCAGGCLSFLPAPPKTRGCGFFFFFFLRLFSQKIKKSLPTEKLYGHHSPLLDSKNCCTFETLQHFEPTRERRNPWCGNDFPHFHVTSRPRVLFDSSPLAIGSDRLGYRRRSIFIHESSTAWLSPRNRQIMDMHTMHADRTGGERVVR
jgi:hypothetical protein